MADFTLFEYIYANIVDVFFLVINWLVVGLVARSPWKQHLKWAVPSAIDVSLELCFRVVKDLHYFLGFGAPMQILVVSQAFWYTGSIIGIYGVWMFWRTIKASIQSAAGKDLFTQSFGEAEPGVWPPPPRVQP